MKWMYAVVLLLILSACGGGGGSSASKQPDADILSCDMKSDHMIFKDTDLSPGRVAGNVTLTTTVDCDASEFLGQWVDAQGGVVKALGTYTIAADKQSSNIVFSLSQDTAIPGENIQLQIIPTKGDQTATAMNMTIVDLVGVEGPGGSHVKNWMYGSDRPLLPLRANRTNHRDNCVFDNGNVLIHDSNYEKYELPSNKNIANDLLYPAYEFDCTDSVINNHRKVWAIIDEGEDDLVHSYSLINDAMYYGNVVFDMYEALLGVRPFDKLRIRPHFGRADSFTISANWDGAYINLGDDIYYSNGLATLETITHEATHAMLNHHSDLIYITDIDYHVDGLMLHEAFSDMATVRAHYYLYNELNWIYGDENQSSKQRFLDKIVTEAGAISSYFDYDDAGPNQYKRMGLITYPFYLLTQKWDVETSFDLFLTSAKECWSPTEPVLHAAQCVLATAKKLNLNEEDVIDAFRSVKIQLKDEDTLAHYTQDVKKLRVQFSDNTHSDFVPVSYLWEFGDEAQSNDVSPYHEYAKGSYTAKLTVEDDQGNTDSFYRTLDVTDEYCQPYRMSEYYREFNTVVVNGTDIGFDEAISDYTDLPAIDVTAGTAFTIVITGTVLNNEHTETGWNVRVDLDDDGEFSDDKGELLYDVKQINNEYNFNHAITIPAEYAGKTLYMRLNGDARQYVSECRVIKGSVFDIRLNVL